jgi:hypothetical protein
MKGDSMIGRVLIAFLAAVVMTALPVGALAFDSSDDVARRDDEAPALVASDDDDGNDDGDTGTRNSRSGTGNSNDRTGSRHTSVSRDWDRSRGDLTRDRTKDGPGGSRRDWSNGHTNDRSRNDTR